MENFQIIEESNQGLVTHNLPLKKNHCKNLFINDKLLSTRIINYDKRRIKGNIFTIWPNDVPCIASRTFFNNVSC